MSGRLTKRDRTDGSRRCAGHLGGACLVALLLTTPAIAAGEGPHGGAGEDSAPEKLPPLQVTVDRAKVDLERRALEVKLSRTASHVRLKVIGESGSVLVDEDFEFKGRPAGTPLSIRWRPSSDEAVKRIEVFGHDAHGYYAGVALTPWSVAIPHEEVTFETNSATIRDSEAPKLEESYRLIVDALKEHGDIGRITLFIAGHTDTVGTAEHNLALSRRRARSIAGWFRNRGLKIPIAYEGFGESVLAVKTGDEVDEPRNRRADYVLAIEEPRLKSGVRPAWKGL